MRSFFLSCVAILSVSSGLASQSHDMHKGVPESSLKECQTSAALPSVHCGRTPTAAFGPNGNLYVVFSQHGHIYLTISSDAGKSYQLTSVVNRIPELIYDDGENRPKIVPGKHNEVFVSWTHKTAGRYSGQVRFARSLDGGKTFDKPVSVNSGDAVVNNRFDSMTLDGQGRIFLVWIDKKDKIAATENSQSFTGASLYYSMSIDSGQSFLPVEKLVDHSCECCRIALDTDNSGRVVALWRHVYPVNIRDHAISYLTPGNPAILNQPTRASNDDWQIDGCPHHGPDLSISHKNQAHMAWFTRGKKNRGLMYGRFDFEKEQTRFLKSIDDSPTASRPQVLVFEDKVYLMWKRFNGASLDLMISYSDDEGESWSTAEPIATTTNGSDHPDWVVNNQQLFAAWHTQSEGLLLIPVVK